MKNKLVIRLPEHMKEKLVLIARHKGLSVTALVKVIIDERVDKELKKISEIDSKEGVVA